VRVSRRSELDDGDLIAGAKSGERAPFRELVPQFQVLAFRVADFITGSAEGAEEATQHAFWRAFFALDRFRPEAPFRPWLLIILADSARNCRMHPGNDSRCRGMT